MDVIILLDIGKIQVAPSSVEEKAEVNKWTELIKMELVKKGVKTLWELLENLL